MEKLCGKGKGMRGGMRDDACVMMRMIVRGS